MKTLFIRNLPFDASETDLRKVFEAYGRVHRCSIAKNRETGESRGFGFVDMDDEPATKAIGEMNGRMFANRTIVVQESDPKARAAGPGGGGPGGGSSRAGADSQSSVSSGAAGRPAGTGGSTFSTNGPRPGGPGAPHRAATGSSYRGAGSSRPGASSSRSSGTSANRNFGPPASPASERNRQYQEKKDRLKPYKRDHFDFRSELEEEEDAAEKRRRAGPDGGSGDDAPAAP